LSKIIIDPLTAGRGSIPRHPGESLPPDLLQYPGVIPLDTIILIGMPGAGKSTVGVILAKALGMRFTDTDLVLQERAGRLLQEIIDAEGPAAFKRSEEDTILTLDLHHAVVATGGSVVFSEPSMAYLKARGTVVYLKVPFGEMVRRISNITTRGIVLEPGQDLAGMFEERAPLYEHYADLTIDGSGNDHERVAETLIRELRNRAGEEHLQGS